MCACGPVVESAFRRVRVLLLGLLEHLQHLVDAEARRLLPRRILLERRQELADVLLCGHQEERVVEQINPSRYWR